jgi:type II secretory pathway pseudopilin PulG
MKQFLKNKLYSSECAGFSLVEISLALLVVAVGILAVFSVFPVSLDQNIQSQNDVTSTLFAEEVFAGLRAHTEESFDFSGFSVPVSAYSDWSWPDKLVNMNTEVTGTNTVYVNIYRRTDNTNIQDHAFRYQLRVYRPIRIEGSGTNQTEQIIGSTNIIAAELEIWQGEFGSTNLSTLYYTEFYDFNN